MKIKSISTKLTSLVTLGLATINVAMAGGPIPPPAVEVSAPSFISLGLIAMVVGLIAYKRKK